MKARLFIALAAALMLATGCKEDKKVVPVEAVNHQADSLQKVINQQQNEINDMMGTLNEIQEGFREITQAENRVSIAKDGEGANQPQAIRENIKFISSAMKRNRELIAKLRKKLRESSVKSDQLQQTIDDFVKQLEDKEKQLTQLRAELAAKDIHIAELDQTIGALTQDVSNLQEESANKTQTINQQDRQLNTAWYVFGTRKELKAQHIIEDGKVLQAHFNKNYFTKVDIRVDKEIKLYSKSAKMLTTHPASSYSLAKDASDLYVLRITNPQIFWSTSKYLVVLVK